MRVGVGHALYAFDPKRVLVLGGVKVQGAWGLRGPADADAVLHAVIDALLGAAALGDRGTCFPPDDDQFRDAPSAVLLAGTLDLLGSEGYQPANVDVSVVAERPPLRDTCPAMRERLASLLRLAPTQVSVKVSEAGGLGALSRAEGIAAIAVASLEDRPA